MVLCRSLLSWPGNSARRESPLCPHPNPVLSLKLRCDHWGAEEQDRPIWDTFWSGGISNSLEVIDFAAIEPFEMYLESTKFGRMNPLS